MGSVDAIVGAGKVVADLLRDELLAVDQLSVALNLKGADVALGDETVAFRESSERAVGGGAVRDEVVEARLEHGEVAVALQTEVRLAADVAPSRGI